LTLTLQCKYFRRIEGKERPATASSFGSRWFNRSACLIEASTMRTAIPMKTALICCLTMILQSSGIASALLDCGCLSAWRMGCCNAAPAEEFACCRPPAASELPPCCETQEDCQESGGSSCPCWQAELEPVVALPSSSRFNLQPDLTRFVGVHAVPALSPATIGGRSASEDRVAVTPRLRLQSLLCVWVI